jgi:SAM-dependent methyltransferase
MAVCAFNSLLCIPDFHLQQQTLMQAARYLRPGGLLALDIWNPLVIHIDGEEPHAYYTRRHTLNGNRYTRFAATGPMNIDQVQTVYGWYDETAPNGQVKRTPYSMEWRVIFRYEITLMLEKAGFKIKDIYGDNRNGALTTSSLKMFIEATRC